MALRPILCFPDPKLHKVARPVQQVPRLPMESDAVDDELTIDEIRTGKYPNVTLRFSMHPLSGKPVAYLEAGDITIVTNGAIQPTLETHTIGRVPTSNVGSYEITWVSQLNVEAGATINGKLAVSVNSKPEVSTGFSFIRPVPSQAVAPRDQAVNAALMPVPLPNPGEVDVPLASSLAAILGGTAFLVTIAGLLGHAIWRRSQDRLAMWVGRSADVRLRAIKKDNQKRRALTVSPTMQFFSRWGAKLVSSAQNQKMRRALVLAGRPTNQHYTRFIAMKAAIGFSLFMGGFWLMVGIAPFTTTLLCSTTLAVIGFMLPTLWLGRIIKNRQYHMRRALPDSLDLITIGVSAGLAFDGALGEIIEKWDNDLSYEFATTLGELRMGSGRRQALLNLADRTQVDEIQVMVSQLIQADELGMSLTDTLLTLSNQMRLRRRQRAEELAHKAAVKMLIPLVFLIFPALFIVILGPATQDMLGFINGGP